MEDTIVRLLEPKTATTVHVVITTISLLENSSSLKRLPSIQFTEAVVVKEALFLSLLLIFQVLLQHPLLLTYQWRSTPKRLLQFQCEKQFMSLCVVVSWTSGAETQDWRKTVLSHKLKQNKKQRNINDNINCIRFYHNHPLPKLSHQHQHRHHDHRRVSVVHERERERESKTSFDSDDPDRDKRREDDILRNRETWQEYSLCFRHAFWLTVIISITRIIIIIIVITIIIVVFVILQPSWSAPSSSPFDSILHLLPSLGRRS